MSSKARVAAQDNSPRQSSPRRASAGANKLRLWKDFPRNCTISRGIAGQVDAVTYPAPNLRANIAHRRDEPPFVIRFPARFQKPSTASKEGPLIRSFLINENDAGQRLDKYLSKAVRRLPQSLLYKYLRLKRIKVNGKKSEIRYRLQPGDRVDLYISDEFFAEEGAPAFLAARPEVRVVYEDQNILLADKPQGLIVHEDEGEGIDTLINRVKRYLYEKGEYDPAAERSFAPALCNRIDRNTGGLVIVAKTAEALRVLNETIREREIDKTYLCLVHGCPKPKEATLTHYHRKDEANNRAIVYDSPRPGARTMVTRYRVLETNGRCSLLEVELETGRTHQIRAQMAHIGCPLVGDGKYGLNAEDKKKGFPFQALYSYKLRFHFPPDSPLGYLNGRVFTAKEVWFAKNGIPDALSE